MIQFLQYMVKSFAHVVIIILPGALLK
jgi:hypothetical protein